MSGNRVPPRLRRRVAAEAGYRCGYCLTSQRVVGPLLEIDHLIPLARGGTESEANLWMACPTCNGAKSDRVDAEDPETGSLVPLFNPRVDVWSEHFEWQLQGTIVAGTTAVGRATVRALNMSHPDIIAARSLWVITGWHPPETEPTVG